VTWQIHAVVTHVKKLSIGYKRVDIVFDQYWALSVKSGTREKRCKTLRPIRRCIECGSVPLPENLSNFLALPENKADLAAFLSIQLSTATYGDIDVVVAGGFVEEDKALSTAGYDVSTLAATHEEADTRIIVHALHTNLKTVVVCERDTDLILLLLHHYQRFQCDEVWVMAGTSAKRKFITIHTVALSMEDKVREL